MQKTGTWLATALTVGCLACGEDHSPTTDAGATGGDGAANGGDAGPDSEGGMDANVNGGESFAAITALGSFTFSEAHDLSAVGYAANGKIYAAGFVDGDANDETDEDKSLVVMRFTAEGALDTSFNGDGLVVHDLAVDGADAGRALVELANGDVVVAANADDGNGGQNVVLAKLDDDGELVTAFGTDGVLTVTFGWAAADDAQWPDAASAPADAVYDVEIDASGADEKLVVMGYGSAAYDAGAATQRTDDDRYIVRLMADDGSVDPAFNGGEVFTWDHGGEYDDDTRRGIVESDGSIVSGGYAHFPGEDGANHVMLLRLKPNGTLDTSFGFGLDASPDGAAVFNPFLDDEGYAEAYAVGRQSDGTYVTGGYGAATGDGVASSMGYATTTAQDLVSFGLKADGTGFSSDFGKDGSGAWAYQSEELAGASTEERGRHLAVLPDDRIVHVGYFGGTAAIYVALPDGALDEAQGDDGLFLFDGGKVTQQFFDVAVSQDGKRIAATTRGFDAEGVRLAILEVADE